MIAGVLIALAVLAVFVLLARAAVYEVRHSLRNYRIANKRPRGQYLDLQASALAELREQRGERRL